MMKSQDKENDIVLSYYDCLLRQADVNLLYGTEWLNDAIIGFYFEYLGQKYEALISKLLFISPELTQLLKLTDAREYSIFLDPIEAKKKEFIFFPINDCNSRRTAGGSHWSLLIFSRAEKTCFYFDSSRGLNTSIAKDFSKGIMRYLLEKGHERFVELDCPQQDNGYDCGLFVLCFADVIASYVLKASKVDGCNCDTIKSMVSEKRRSLIDLINTLKESKD